jgi:hypothetical protein
MTSGFDRYCEKCRFFMPSEDRNSVQEKINLGECHRYPPIYLGDDINFPLMNGVSDWCGEWQPNSDDIRSLLCRSVDFELAKAIVLATEPK